MLVIVDYLTRKVRYIPSKTTDNTTTVIRRLEENVFKEGVPSQIMSDRDPRLTSTEWKQYCEKMGIVNDFTDDGRHEESEWARRESHKNDERKNWNVYKRWN